MHTRITEGLIKHCSWFFGLAPASYTSVLGVEKPKRSSLKRKEEEVERKRREEEEQDNLSQSNADSSSLNDQQAEEEEEETAEGSKDEDGGRVSPTSSCKLLTVAHTYTPIIM